MDNRNSISDAVSGIARRELNDLISLYLYSFFASCLFVCCFFLLSLNNEAEYTIIQHASTLYRLPETFHGEPTNELSLMMTCACLVMLGGKNSSTGTCNSKVIMFMVLSLRHRHCESSPGLYDECKTLIGLINDSTKGYVL